MTAELDSTANSNEPASWRSRRWFVHLAQYAVAGALAAACDMAVFTVLVKSFGVNYLISTLTSFIVGTAVNFLICFGFVFRLTGHSWVVALWRKLLSSLVALAVNLFMMYPLVDGLGFGGTRSEFFLFDGLVIARGIAIGVSFLLNFILTKYYAFKDY